ncbi:hypothetical protein Y032_0002g654 [Ancylostoma ceylanicum]|uniref:Uncharacterized protein n=1 Tax=Ancylostoma ceylanicum TaxID=53326 RepID=A0A016W024_9BILA|nr:hypothetical protein Y032_0002g654 [Ancylostoma ceylanicum]
MRSFPVHVKILHLIMHEYGPVLPLFTLSTGNVNHDCHSRGRLIYVAPASAVDVGCCLARAAWMLRQREWQS